MHPAHSALTPNAPAFVTAAYAALYPKNPAFTSADVLRWQRRRAGAARMGQDPGDPHVRHPAAA